jgi:hypothetical protein
MTIPSDAPVQTVSSPNSNKTVGSGVGAFAGGGVGVLFIVFLNYRGITLGDTEAGIVASLITAGAGAVGTFFAPLLTAAQNRAVRALDGSASTDQKTVQKIAVAQAIVSAASTFSKNPTA